MDDQEFGGGGETRRASSALPTPEIQAGSLSLREVQDLTQFLKNMAFALYWHALDIREDQALEQAAGLGPYFQGRDSKPLKKVLIQSRYRSQEIARSHLRDLVTGLLRSIHQRE